MVCFVSKRCLWELVTFKSSFEVSMLGEPRPGRILCHYNIRPEFMYIDLPIQGRFPRAGINRPSLHLPNIVDVASM